MRLHVRVLGAEELLRTFDRDGLDLVDMLAAAVPAPAGIALGVFVGQHAALGLYHRLVGEILGADELDMALLAGELGGNRRVNFRIEGLERRGVEGHSIAECGGWKTEGKDNPSAAG